MGVMRLEACSQNLLVNRWSYGSVLWYPADILLAGLESTVRFSKVLAQILESRSTF